jgi:Holliday junction resolvase RusA-like endonuclease
MIEKICAQNLEANAKEIDDLVFTLPGAPITKLRPRFSRHKGKVRTYDSQSEEKNTIGWQLKARMKGRNPLQGPLRLDIKFYMPIPKSASKKKKEQMASGEIKHTKTPDCDNMVKAYLDCMNDIVYIDDKQIYKLNATKLYGEYPRTEIKICEELGKESVLESG